MLITTEAFASSANSNWHLSCSNSAVSGIGSVSCCATNSLEKFKPVFISGLFSVKKVLHEYTSLQFAENSDCKCIWFAKFWCMNGVSNWVRNRKTLSCNRYSIFHINSIGTVSVEISVGSKFCKFCKF